MRSIGIDIGGTSVKVSILECSPLGQTRLISQSKSEGYRNPSALQLSAAVAEAVERGMPRAQLGQDLGAVGWCAPGLVDSSGVLLRSVNLPELVGTCLLSLVQRALGCEKSELPIARFTDAYAAGIDIYMAGGYTDRLLALSIGTGVGAAVIDCGGQQLVLHGESSGHFGQMDVSLDDEPHVPIGPDGGRGSLEAYIGIAALDARYGTLEESVLKALDRRSPPIRALARAIRIGHAIYRPDRIVLLGGIGIRLVRALPELIALVGTSITSVARAPATICCGEHDFHAASGCARRAAHAGPVARG